MYQSHQSCVSLVRAYTSATQTTSTRRIPCKRVNKFHVLKVSIEPLEVEDGSQTQNK